MLKFLLRFSYNFYYLLFVFAFFFLGFISSSTSSSSSSITIGLSNVSLNSISKFSKLSPGFTLNISLRYSYLDSWILSTKSKVSEIKLGITNFSVLVSAVRDIFELIFISHGLNYSSIKKSALNISKHPSCLISKFLPESITA